MCVHWICYFFFLLFCWYENKVLLLLLLLDVQQEHTNYMYSRISNDITGRAHCTFLTIHFMLFFSLCLTFAFILEVGKNAICNMCISLPCYESLFFFTRIVWICRTRSLPQFSATADLIVPHKRRTTHCIVKRKRRRRQTLNNNTWKKNIQNIFRVE